MTKDESKILASDITLQVFGNQKICVVGNNGCAKLHYCIRFMMRYLKREDIHIGYMPQNYDEILDAYESPIDFLTTVGG